ncbi:hypothetical protein STRTUCAR8_01950 [Streptomyces turgidiscabies Car8]|uniref:Uncharacterized protein n=1 Tax=Streptomyces turgidiscabies (strain Car8) TaxID=698760 RepID=L7F669_STRT8|nr:hypothetical protein STRTUCAR8_01950 [Streptomyces turgidiscabies Car8]
MSQAQSNPSKTSPCRTPASAVRLRVPTLYATALFASVAASAQARDGDAGAAAVDDVGELVIGEEPVGKVLRGLGPVHSSPASVEAARFSA